ncbi:hypothetical protein P879_08770 [Paragonimus westermani]|uniref:UVR domain-containing protein n=1 Tax=Paragonimus westermani TaxID=34504 RepID=A0A8T0D1G1_9TREM|nr:hypothetical protein P879_08770 [Paragonimus westermani]
MASGTEPLAMLEVFQECQLNSLSHVRLCVRLKNIFLKSRFSHFCDEFFELCRYSLVSMERTPFRERTIDFIVKFALFCGKSEDDGEPTDTLNNRLLLKLFLFCMKYNECPNPAVRFRCMQIIHKLLEGIGDNGVIPDELYQSLQSVLLRRVQDIKAAVRVQAVQALSRMQDPTVANCPAVEAFLWLARHDPTTEVRRAALAAMVLTTKTLPSLIERCRDLSDTVRRTAYKILTARSVLRPLSIAKRIRILQDGLTDRSAEVRQAAQELVLAWFNATNRDPIHLLRRLDTEGVPETSQLMLDNLFAALSETEFDQMVTEWAAKCLTEQKTLNIESHTAEAAFFWRALVEFLHKRAIKAKPELSCSPSRLAPTESPRPEEIAQTEQACTTTSVESILPSVTAYVDMTKRLVDRLVEMVLAGDFDEKTMEQECVVENVLRLAHSIDLSDEFGRRRLVTLIHDWITSPTVPNTLSPHLLKVHALLEPSLRKRINSVIEMISELCDPVEPPPLSASNPPSVQAPDGITNNQPSTDGINGVNEAKPPVIGKEEERAIRLKIAKIEVRMNELNESLHNCVRRKEFEQATGLRDECAQLETERSALLHQLHGSPLTTAVTQPVDGDTSNAFGDTKSDPDSAAPVIVHSDDEPKLDDGEDREEPHSLLDRCSAAVLLKANRLAALVVQQSPTLWRLPASLRSLLDSLIFPSIQHGDPSVRNQAILTLGLCCSMDLPLAIQYMSLFYSVSFCGTPIPYVNCFFVYLPLHISTVNLSNAPLYVLYTGLR